MAAPHTSLIMIVRNEQANLPDCVNSVRDLFGEIVIVDTGSTDQTKDVAASFGARVYDFAWCDSFAAARNESLSHATGEWIFWLDADDRLDPPNRAKLEAFLQGLGDQQVAYSMRYDTFTQGTPAVAYYLRLFRRDSGARWRYRVHENLDWPPPRPPVVATDIAVHHIGYRDPQISNQKDHRNLRLLEMDIQDHSDDVHVLLHLGRCYTGLGRFAEAMEILEKCLRLAAPGSVSQLWSFYSLLQTSLRQSKWELALHYCTEGLKFFPNDALLRSDGQKLARKLSSPPR